MNKFSKRIEQLFSIMLALSALSMLGAGFIQVFSRYILKVSLSWSEEFMRYLYVWATMLGIGLGIKQNMFTAITSLYDQINKKSKTGGLIVYSVVAFIQLAFFIILAYYGARYAIRNMSQLSPSMQVSMGLMDLSLAIGGILGVVYTSLQIRDKIMEVIK